MSVGCDAHRFFVLAGLLSLCRKSRIPSARETSQVPSAYLAIALTLLSAPPEVPQVKDNRLQLQLVAEAPQIVTPTGLAVDRQGRVLVIESHTHFRPDGYQGPERDRILLMDQFGEDGKAGRVRVWFEGTTHTMNIAVEPQSGVVYVATRAEVFTLEDTDGDDKADKRTPICRLDTKGNYPHNGLSGFAFRDGQVYFGFGENLGVDYKLIGSDGRELAGGGEGGNIYRCNLDGSQLERIATGFWNPFHVCFDATGNFFTVDNDPDARPPCRLLHVVQGGDYGFRFRHGRRGANPLTAWNGELPGTLPMVAGTGEAPSAVVFYDHHALPESYFGQLLVTSWGDHRIEGYELRVASNDQTFRSEMKPIVVGGENFRPVGMAIAPDGSLYFSDWVDKSYQLHGKGRVWRLSAKQPGKAPAANRSEKVVGLAQPLNGSLEEAAKEVEQQKLDLNQPFHAQAIARLVGRQLQQHGNDWMAVEKAMVDAGLPRASVQRGMLALWCGGFIAGKPEWLPPLLSSDDPQVRLAAVLVVAEHQLKQFRGEVEQALSRVTTKQEFEVCLATLDLLGKNDNRSNDWTGEFHALRTVKAPTAKPAVRALALRVLRVDHPELTVEFLKQSLADQSPEVRLEAIRTARQRNEQPLKEAIQAIAADRTQPPQQRAEAVLGLDADQPETRKLLIALAADPNEAVAAEALRQLRGTSLNGDERSAIAAASQNRSAAIADLAALALDPNDKRPHPAEDALQEWVARGDGPGDAEAGERIFFSPKSVGCWRCHEHAGRGAAVGPALSTIARNMTRERLVESIVQPSKEIAPLYTPWLVQLDDGRTLTGMYVGEEVDGTLRLADNTGKIHRLHPRQIEVKQPSEQSIMPAGLAQQLTAQEWRDLLAFLLRP